MKQESWQLALVGLAGVAVVAGALVVVSTGGNGAPDPASNAAPPENWTTYADDDHGFELQYPPTFDRTDPNQYPYGIPGNATTLFLARDGDDRIVVGHTDAPLAEFEASRSNETAVVGFEAAAEFSAFESRQVGGSAGYEFTRTWFSGTGAGSEGISCRGPGAVTAAPEGGTLYVVVERCSEDIDDHPPITPEVETTFDRILDSFERTG